MTSKFGGVGRNIADRLAMTDNMHVSLVSAVADDMGGKALIAHTNANRIHTENMLVLSSKDGNSTATYTAIHGQDGDLCVGLADMSILERLSAEHISGLASQIRVSDLVVADANLNTDAFTALTGITQSYNVPLFFEPTSDHKCLLPVITNTWAKVFIYSFIHVFIFIFIFIFSHLCMQSHIRLYFIKID